MKYQKLKTQEDFSNAELAQVISYLDDPDETPSDTFSPSDASDQAQESTINKLSEFIVQIVSYAFSIGFTIGVLAILPSGFWNFLSNIPHEPTSPNSVLNNTPISNISIITRQDPINRGPLHDRYLEKSFEKIIYINLTRPKHSHFYHWMTEEFLPFIYFASRKPNARYVVYRKQNEKKDRHHPKEDDIFWNAFDAIYKRLPYEVLFTTDLNPEAEYSRLEKWANPREHWKLAKEKMLLAFEVVRNIVPAPKRKYDIIFQYRDPKGRRGMKNMEECKNLTDEILDATTYMWKPSNDPEDFWKDVELFRGANTIVLVHGAGMVHAWWADSGHVNLLEYQPGPPYREHYLEKMRKVFGFKVKQIFRKGMSITADCHQMVEKLQAFGYKKRDTDKIVETSKGTINS